MLRLSIINVPLVGSPSLSPLVIVHSVVIPLFHVLSIALETVPTVSYIIGSHLPHASYIPL